MTEWSLGSGRSWHKQEVGWELWRKNFLGISSLREARVVRFAADHITMYACHEKNLYPVYTIQPVVKTVVQPDWQPAVSCKQTFNQFDNRAELFVQLCWTNSHCSFNRLSNRVVQSVWQPTVYTIQPFVKPLRTGWMFVYTIQPVVNPLWQPVRQQDVSCKRGFRMIWMVLCWMASILSTLTLDCVRRHTVVHQSSSSIYKSNFIEIGIGQHFCGRTNHRDPSMFEVTWLKK